MAKRNPNSYSLQQIEELLFASDASLIRGLLRIYSHQTADEKRSASVNRHNNLGFTGADARFLSSLAEQAIRKGTLSPAQLNCLRPKMKKYVRQLTAFANGKI